MSKNRRFQVYQFCLFLCLLIPFHFLAPSVLQASRRDDSKHPSCTSNLAEHESQPTLVNINGRARTIPIGGAGNLFLGLSSEQSNTELESLARYVQQLQKFESQDKVVLFSKYFQRDVPGFDGWIQDKSYTPIMNFSLKTVHAHDKKKEPIIAALEKAMKSAIKFSHKSFWKKDDSIAKKGSKSEAIVDELISIFGVSDDGAQNFRKTRIIIEVFYEGAISSGELHDRINLILNNPFEIQDNLYDPKKYIESVHLYEKKGIDEPQFLILDGNSVFSPNASSHILQRKYNH